MDAVGDPLHALRDGCGRAGVSSAGRRPGDHVRATGRHRASGRGVHGAVMTTDTLRIGITCYPSVGGSGVLATALGEDLAERGHDVHFIAYERPFRLPSDAPRLHFHPVAIHEYELFRFPDYTLPLSVRMAEVSRDHRLDVLHVHYAVPHAP